MRPYFAFAAAATALIAGTACAAPVVYSLNKDHTDVVFEVSQEMLDALFALTYAEKNDPGPSPSETPKVNPPPAK